MTSIVCGIRGRRPSTPWFVAVCVLFAAILLSTSGWAQSTRILIAVSHRRGLDGERPLDYPPQDVQRIVEVYQSLGQVKPSHTVVLADPTTSTLDAALARAVELARMSRPRDVVVYFYFSGHGDREALHLGNEIYRQADLASYLDRMPAFLRVGIVDACRTTAVTRTKGMSVEPGFAISLGALSEASGTVWVHASADGEAAQESSELGGSIFTHYWLSGLRGAADRDGDRWVSLSEAYHYAYNQTLVRSARASGVLQRPSVAMNLSEIGPVNLTEIGTRGATIAMAPGADIHYLIYGVRSQAVIAEAWGLADRPVEIALAPGEYVIHRLGPRTTGAAEIRIASRERRVLSAQDFRTFSAEELALKGGAVVIHPWEIELGYSLASSNRFSVGQEGMARVAYSFGPWALGVGAFVGKGHDTTLSNEIEERWVGGNLRLERRQSWLGLTWRLGAGPAMQNLWQDITRLDAERVSRAGYASTRSYRGIAFGGVVAAGCRLELVGRTWFGLEAAGQGMGAKTSDGLLWRWSLGGTAVLGARF